MIDKKTRSDAIDAACGAYVIAASRGDSGAVKADIRDETWGAVVDAVLGVLHEVGFVRPSPLDRLAEWAQDDACIVIRPGVMHVWSCHPGDIDVHIHCDDAQMAAGRILKAVQR